MQEEEVEQSWHVRNDECEGHQQEVSGVELDGDVEAEVVEDDVGGEEGGEELAEQTGAAKEDEEAGGNFGGAADDFVDRVEADEGPEHGHGRGVAEGLVEDGERGRRHLQWENLGEAIANHRDAEGEANREAEPEEESRVGEGVVAPGKLGQRGPDDGGEDGEGEHDTDGDPVEDRVAGAGVVEFCADAGEVEQVLAEPLGGVEERPGRPAFEVLADVEGDDLPEGSVAGAEGVEHEVAEGETEGEAGGGVARYEEWRWTQR